MVNVICSIQTAHKNIFVYKQHLTLFFSSSLHFPLSRSRRAGMVKQAYACSGGERERTIEREYSISLTHRLCAICTLHVYTHVYTLVKRIVPTLQIENLLGSLLPSIFLPSQPLVTNNYKVALVRLAASTQVSTKYTQNRTQRKKKKTDTK